MAHRALQADRRLRDGLRALRQQRRARPTGQVNIGGEKNATGTAQLPLNVGRTSRRPTTARPSGCTSTARRSTSTADRPHRDVDRALRIGGNSFWGEYFRGLIDDVRIYNRALTAAEIQADMTTPVRHRPAATRRRRRALTSPAAGPVCGTVTLAAGAWDDRGVAGVLFRSTAPTPAPRTRPPVLAQLGHARPASGSAHAHRDRARRRRQPHDERRRSPSQSQRGAEVRQRQRDHRPRRADRAEVHARRPHADRRARRHDLGRPARRPASTRQPLLQLPERRDRLRARPARPRARSGFATQRPSTSITRTGRGATASRASPSPATARPPRPRRDLAERRQADIWHQGGDLPSGPTATSTSPSATTSTPPAPSR